MKKCEHGLTTSVCYVCASAKYGDQNIDNERLRDAARIALTAEADAVVDKLRAERRGMTRIYYWCPMYRAYVYAVVPTQVAFTLMGWV